MYGHLVLASLHSEQPEFLFLCACFPTKCQGIDDDWRSSPIRRPSAESVRVCSQLGTLSLLRLLSSCSSLLQLAACVLVASRQSSASLSARSAPAARHELVAALSMMNLDRCRSVHACLPTTHAVCVVREFSWCLERWICRFETR